MAYLDVISLADAKNYLRIDEDLTDDDVQLSIMIKASLGMIEQFTNHFLFARDKTYLLQCNKVLVYDYPINNVVSNSDTLTTENKETFTYYTDYNNETITLNVGYSSVNDIPNELKIFALEYIKYMYYGSQKNKGVNNDIPDWLQKGLDSYRRFII